MSHPSRAAGRNRILVMGALALYAAGCRKSDPAAPLPPAPTLTSISPDTGVSGTIVPVTFTGTNFVAGATQVASTDSVTVSALTVTSSTSMTANLVLTSAASGGVLVSVTTPGGTGTQWFTVLPAPPTLLNILPNFGGQGSTVAVSLGGTNFVVGGTSVDAGGGGVTVSNVSVASSQSLTASFTIDSAATLGTHLVKVSTAGGSSGSISFTVNTPPPVTGAKRSSHPR